MLIKIIAVGKLKDKSLSAKADEFARWLGPHAKLEIVELRDGTSESEAALILRELERSQGYVFALSEEGREYTSRQFAEKIGSVDRKLIFVIGGPDGLGPGVREKADVLWSLSRLTFTHEMARFLLLEQLFRAVNINKGGAYHRD